MCETEGTNMATGQANGTTDPGSEVPRVAQPDVAVSPALVVSITEAARMLSICKRTAERERDRGKLHCLLVGGRWKVRVGELHAYLHRMEKESSRST
jgi:excisionase family DNA binding protein